MPDLHLDRLALGTRNGLPDELLRLREKHPRETWSGHVNLGEWVQFWLSRHAIFRDVGAMLDAGFAQLAENRATVDEFRPWFAPRLQYLLGHLDLHHRVEEFHIFPAFTRAEPSLVHGFALLEADHEVIHALVDTVTATSAAFIPQHQSADGDASAAVEPARQALAALLDALAAHLDDEEDLIVPIVLERSEANLGLF